MTDYTPGQLVIAAVGWALAFAAVLGMVREERQDADEADQKDATAHPTRIE